MDKQIHVFPKRREEIDIDRLAEALLDLLMSLPEDERSRLNAEGEQLRRRMKGGRSPRKGSAA